MVGGNFSTIVAAVLVTILVFLAIAARRAAVFERGLSHIADDAAAVSAPSLTARGRPATIRWILGVVAWIALILVVDWALIFVPRTFADNALLWTNLGVALASLGLAIHLSGRLRPARLLARRSGTIPRDVDTASRGRISLGLAVAGIVLLVGGLILILVFGDLGRMGQVPTREGYLIFLCIGLFLILEWVSLGSGIASRGTAMGIAGMVLSGVLLLLLGLPILLWLLFSVLEGMPPRPLPGPSSSCAQSS
jgi:hypothetical protein